MSKLHDLAVEFFIKKNPHLSKPEDIKYFCRPGYSHTYDSFLAGAKEGGQVCPVVSNSLANAVHDFIDKTQAESKKTGENQMKAPKEYVKMMEALLRYHQSLL